MDVRTLCLGVLSLGDATGYEIKKMFEKGLFSHCLEASYGSIYPALNKLAAEGLVSYRDEPQVGRPDKKVYSLTPKGRAIFQAALYKQPAEDKFRSEFLFYSVFSHLLPSNHMTKLVDRQIAWMKRQAADTAASIANTNTDGMRFVKGFTQTICEAGIKYLEENRHLIENRKESDDNSPSPPPTAPTGPSTEAAE